MQKKSQTGSKLMIYTVFSGPVCQAAGVLCQLLLQKSFLR